MSIIYNESKKTYTLLTAETAYQMKVSEYGYLLHLYYGRRVEDEDLSYLIQLQDRGFSPCPNELGNDRTFSLDFLPQEFSTDGNCDYRTGSIEVENGDGSRIFVGKVLKHKIYDGKYQIHGMPSLHAGENDTVQTLEIWLQDEVSRVTAVLCYSVFEEKNIITRTVRVENSGDHPVNNGQIITIIPV